MIRRYVPQNISSKILYRKQRLTELNFEILERTAKLTYLNGSTYREVDDIEDLEEYASVEKVLVLLCVYQSYLIFKMNG